MGILGKFVGLVFSGRKKPEQPTVSQRGSHERATALMHAGDLQGAIKEHRLLLEANPFDVVILNDMGACLSHIGDEVGAQHAFELAYSLDDAFIPAVTNRAKIMADRRQSSEALTLLRRAKVCDPNFGHIDTIYGQLCLSWGDAKGARLHQLRAWSSGFNNLRVANCFLFQRAYADLSEKELASEHRFWAETLAPSAIDTSDGTASQEQDEASAGDGKIRIGYWSPDFRNHSVRFFSRPLIENHDRTRFEVFLYHDFPGRDPQTDLMQAASDHFHEVSQLSDGELHALIRSHRLDVLVELAGHSSHNRLSLLRDRMATVQISALGYPPTTGLRGIDAKVLDPHVLTPDCSAYYAEAPLVLPSSFWCFDPMEEAPVADEPPVVANRYITFACVGNVGKINARMMQRWRDILMAVPTARLLVRSISFEDPHAQETMRATMAQTGLPMDRVDTIGPARGPAFFESYNDVDIILDTFPFNGGTTTCFATYMGVPVVTLSGESLIGRMGRSIMTNLGAARCVVSDYEAYTRCAIELAHDVEFLREFRREARGRYKNSSLGNGAMYARDFEQACLNLLEQKKSAAAPVYQSTIPDLPADEIVRRAYAVWGGGQKEAAGRILAYCLRTYPDFCEAHMLKAQLMADEGQLAEAVDYLLARKDRFAVAGQASVLIAVVRFNLLLGRRDRAGEFVAQLADMQIEDTFDRLQAALFQACISPVAPDLALPDEVGEPTSLHFLVPCDSVERFDAMRAQILETCRPPVGMSLSFERCSEADRVTAYQAALADERGGILVLMQKNIEIHHPGFAQQIAAALTSCDVAGFSGSTRWTRIDWRSDEFTCKAGSFLIPSSEGKAFTEIQWMGDNRSEVVPGMAVLDGALIAVKRGALPVIDFDEELLDCQTLMEEAWVHAASQRGARVAVHANLAVLISPDVALDESNMMEARMRMAEVLQIDPLATFGVDNLSLSAPIERPGLAAGVCSTFLSLAR